MTRHWPLVVVLVLDEFPGATAMTVSDVQIPGFRLALRLAGMTKGSASLILAEEHHLGG